MAFASDYNDVPARIREFREKHPEGSLQATVIRWPEEGFPFVAVEARAYRTPDDERPGVGLAYEPVPGKTNFTRDSELQNAETSAWGRAIVAVGAADTKKGIASAEDVRNRSEESRSGGAGEGVPSERDNTSGSVSTKAATAYGEGVAQSEGADPDSPHVHDYYAHPTNAKREVCACGLTRPRQA